MSALTFDVSINELDINKIQVGQKVEITADALDGQSFTGTVDKVNINGTTSGGVTSYPVTVVIDDPGMSRRHFEITVTHDHATATDLGSTNGTLLDGRPIDSVSLSEGTVLTAGDTPVTYSEAGSFRE